MGAPAALLAMEAMEARVLEAMGARVLEAMGVRVLEEMEAWVLEAMEVLQGFSIPEPWESTPVGNWVTSRPRC